jgi:hypothetical protein
VGGGVTEGVEEGVRNDPNIVCTYEKKKRTRIKQQETKKKEETTAK